jgi:cellulose biosynthesis protein BcsS
MVSLPVPALGETWELSGGYQSDDRGQYLAYLSGGAKLSVPSAKLPFEPFIHVLVFRQRYLFKVDGLVLEGHLNQVSPSVGIAKTLGNLEVLVSAGPAFQDTREQSDEGEKITSTGAGYDINAYASYWMEKDGFEGTFSYINLQDFFFGRTRWKHITLDKEQGHPINLTAGLDLQAVGNSQFQQYFAGGLLETEVGKLELLIKGGYQYNTTFHSGTYAGIELYLAF